MNIVGSFLLLGLFLLVGSALFFKGLDDIEDDDNVDSHDGQDGRGDGGHGRLEVIVLEQLLGAKVNSKRQEEHEKAVREETKQSLA